MSEKKQRQPEEARPWAFTGDGSRCVPGVPMRDLTEAEYEGFVESGRIVADDPSGKLYKREAAKPAAKRGAE